MASDRDPSSAGLNATPSAEVALAREIQEVKELREENTRLRSALKKAHLAFHNEHTEAIFTFAFVRGFNYEGPVFTEDEYRKAIGAP